jgi:hypothetical protein
MTVEVAAHIRALANEILLGSSFSLEGPIAETGLSIVPIIPVEEVSTGEFRNAAEAFELGILEIIEAGDAVNTIIARNTGKIPILIEEAEVLKAEGSQDRIVVQSVLLQPGAEQRIPVKCIHAPHPLGAGAGFSSMGSGTADIKAKMRLRKYVSIMTDVEHYVPEQAVDQGEVWENVERYCKSLGMGDPTKYTDALSKVQEEAGKLADRIRDSLPKDTCGLVILDAKGEVIALELYRRSQAFWKREGFLESIILEYSNVEAKELEGEVAWSKALQFIFRLRDMDPGAAAAKEDSDNVIFGFGDLKGEAVLGLENEKNLRSILYCTLGK